MIYSINAYRLINLNYLLVNEGISTEVIDDEGFLYYI